jgi:CBS domain-containing protein
MIAREIMSYQPLTVTRTDTVRRAAELMRNVGIGALPVVDEGRQRRLEGIITDRDLVVRCLASAHEPWCLVGAHMTPAPLTTVGPDDDVLVVIHAMERARVRRIPVVSKDGVLLGIIAQADVATKVGPTQPEKVEELIERISSFEPVAARPNVSNA